MSPIPVREALRGLASRGLVEAIARPGFRVRLAARQDFAETPGGPVTGRLPLRQ
jgi:DNA-binding GntR family transcriptional regulator